jgi:acyl transferase domain-containing protein/SAM-dependent methyltransferase
VAENKDELLQRALLTIKKLRGEVERAAGGAPQAPIAVVGAACELPGGIHSLDEYWELLSEGRSAIGEIPPSRKYLHKLFAQITDPKVRAHATRMGLVRDPYGFDHKFFGISPKEALKIDPQHRLLLELTWRSLESACIDPFALRESDTGVFVGIGNSDYYQSIVRHGYEVDAYVASGNAPAMAAGRLSYFYGFKGPCVAFDTACSSSLVGVNMACHALQRGECRVAIVGAVNLILTEVVSVTFALANMLAADGRCKVFSDDADGYVRAEGAAVLVLKRLSEAIADGDPVLAVVRATAINQDGRSHGLTAPNGPSQRAVIEKALEDAGLQRDDVDYLEAHGTGTKLGDPVEVNTLMDLFVGRRRPLLVGSVKANVGHLEPAAGMASLLKVICAMRHGEIPKQIQCDPLNRHIDWGQAPLVIPAENTPWPESRDGRRRIASISGFGFSGTNAHVILECPPPPAAPASCESRDWIFTASAADEAALRALLRAYADHLSRTDASPPSVSFTACTCRAHLAWRFATTFRDVGELAYAVRAAVEERGEAGVMRAPGEAQSICVVVGADAGLRLAEIRREFADHPVVRACSNGMGEAREREQFVSTVVALRLLESMGVKVGRYVAWGAGFAAAAYVLGHVELRSALALVAGNAQDVEIRAAAAPFSDRLGAPGVLAATLDAGRAEDWLAIARETLDSLPVELREREVCVTIGDGLGEALAALYRAGVDIRWDGYFAGLAPRKIALPTYEFTHTYFNACESFESAPTNAAPESVARYACTESWREVPLVTSLGPNPNVTPIVCGLAAHPDVQSTRAQYARYCRMVAEAEALCERAALHMFKNALHIDGPAELRRFAAAPESYIDAGSSYRPLLLHLAKTALERCRDATDFARVPASMGPELADFAKRHPEFAVDTELLSSCVGSLVDIVQGNKDPKAILFSGGADSLASRVYKSSITNDYLNKQIQLLVREIVKLHRGDRKLRILEIGAGTGATTEMVVRELDPARTDYCFTDISPFFLNLAQKRFGKYGCFEFRLLNIEERESASQFFAEKYDVVIAVNVLHATSSIEASVRNVAELLLEGGTLVLRECTRPTLTADMTFGLTPGWWLFKDANIRRDYPLLDCQQWSALLGAHAFARVCMAIPEADAYENIIVASKTGNVRLQRPLVLHHGDRPRETADDCASYLSIEALLEGDDSCLPSPAEAPTLDVVLADPTPLAGLDASPDAVIDRYFHGVVAAVQRLAKASENRALRLYFLTKDAMDVRGGDRLRGLGQALTTGLARVVAREFPQCYGAAIDVDTEDLAVGLGYVATEASCGTPEQEVAYRDGRRYVRRLRPRAAATVAADADAARASVRGDATYLVTGGLGGLGLATARWLVERGARHLVLVSRRAHDGSAAVGELCGAGAVVEVCAGDVADLSSLRAVFARFGRDLPPLGGIVHSAGVGGSRPIAEIERGDLDGMFAAKVEGTLNLHRLSLDHSPDFFVVYSSMIATWGAVSRAHYAAVNHFSDQLVLLRNKLGLPGLSIDWGPWSGSGMLDERAEAQAKWLGVDALKPEEYLQAFGELLDAGARGVVVVAKADWERLHASYSQHRPLFLLAELQRADGAQGGSVDDAGEAPWADADGSTAQATIRSTFAELLGYTGVDAIDEERGFFEQGMDSLLAIRFAEMLHARLKTKLKTTDLFNYNNVIKLAAFVSDRASAGRVDSKHGATDGQRRALDGERARRCPSPA